VCAQALHWFGTRAALDAIARVLVPGGVLGLIWNVRDETVPWVAALSAITDEFQGDAPRYKTGRRREAFAGSGFTAIDERHATYAHAGSVEEVVIRADAVGELRRRAARRAARGRRGAPPHPDRHDTGARRPVARGVPVRHGDVRVRTPPSREDAP
jgi:SAM-dependent methyltransferase